MQTVSLSFKKQLYNLNNIKKILEVFKDSFPKINVKVDENGLQIIQKEKINGNENNFIIYCNIGKCDIFDIQNDFETNGKYFERCFKSELLYKSIKCITHDTTTIENNNDDLIIRETNRLHKIICMNEIPRKINFFLNDKICSFSVKNSVFSSIIKSIKSLDFGLVMFNYVSFDKKMYIKSKQSLQEVSFDINTHENTLKNINILQEYDMKEIIKILKCVSLEKMIFISIYLQGIKFKYIIKDSHYLELNIGSLKTKIKE